MVSGRWGYRARVAARNRIARALLIGLAAGWTTAYPLLAEQKSPPHEPPLEEIFRQAQSASSAKDYAQAEKLYRRILAADPSILSARVNLGLALYWQRKNREAATELERALRENSKEFSSLLFSGLAYLDLGEYDRAQKQLLAAARVKDTDAILFWALGSLAMIHADSNNAVPLLERSLALDPNNVRAVWLLGQAYARLAYRKEERPLVPADYAELVEKSMRFVERQQPDGALVHVLRGDVLAARDLTSEALAEYQQAQKLDPHWPDLHLMMGSLLGLLGRWDEALAEERAQLKSFPGDPRALVELGSVYGRSGNYAAAIQPLEQALAHDAANYEAHYRLGQALVNLGRNREALSHLESAAALNPAKSDPCYLLHRAYRALNNPEMAARALAEFNRRKAASNP
jgi:tetratricopeptide (TPR) repeat protein